MIANFKKKIKTRQIHFLSSISQKLQHSEAKQLFLLILPFIQKKNLILTRKIRQKKIALLLL